MTVYIQENGSNSLTHFGVMGMKWGKRSARSQGLHDAGQQFQKDLKNVHTAVKRGGGGIFNKGEDAAVMKISQKYDKAVAKVKLDNPTKIESWAKARREKQAAKDKAFEADLKKLDTAAKQHEARTERAKAQIKSGKKALNESAAKFGADLDSIPSFHMTTGEKIVGTLAVAAWVGLAIAATQ